MRISDWSSDVCSSDLPAVDLVDIGPVVLAMVIIEGFGRHVRRERVPGPGKRRKFKSHATLLVRQEPFLSDAAESRRRIRKALYQRFEQFRQKSAPLPGIAKHGRAEGHTSELQSLIR